MARSAFRRELDSALNGAMVDRKDGLVLNTAAQEILAYYGVTQAQITAAGGSVIFGVLPSSRTNFDVAIYTGDLSQAPEFNL